VVPGAAAASYASGGGEVVLEHQYGAALLGSLLTGDPLPELGDDATPTVIRFQASAVSAVDDLLIKGRTPDGGIRQASVGVRRAPKLIKSEAKSRPGEGDGKSVRLVATYLKVVAGAWDEIVAGRWRLVLAAVSWSSAVRQAGDLAEIARAAGSEAAFREELVDGEHDQLRNRLDHLDALVIAALQDGGHDGALTAGELTWRWLFSLRVRQLRLEDADTTDRTFAVTRLRAVTADGTAAGADGLFSKLEGLSARYAPAGAIVDEASCAATFRVRRWPGRRGTREPGMSWTGSQRSSPTGLRPCLPMTPQNYAWSGTRHPRRWSLPCGRPPPGCARPAPALKQATPVSIRPRHAMWATSPSSRIPGTRTGACGRAEIAS
jgi:hypothetical protein